MLHEKSWHWIFAVKCNVVHRWSFIQRFNPYVHSSLSEEFKDRRMQYDFRFTSLLSYIFLSTTGILLLMISYHFCFLSFLIITDTLQIKILTRNIGKLNAS